MESTLFVGLDAHRSSIVATVVDREGNKVDQTRLGSGDEELRQYLPEQRGLPTAYTLPGDSGSPLESAPFERISFAVRSADSPS